jgi:leucyl-tRNA synthetase
MLHERGLAYQAESLVNYDPVDKTVLANEQVDANGCSWRSGAKVEKVMLKQWFLRIKEYQEPLLKDLDGLAHEGRWPEKVLAMQRNWIGKSEGATIRFDAASTTNEGRLDPLDVFTTRADTLFGVQYIALSLGHPIVQQEALEDASLRAFIERAKDLPADSKEGYLLPKVRAQNPIADQIPGVESALPVYVAPYVLDDYGSGAVMGVPGHDNRDHAFWRANVGSDPIRVVVTTEPGTAPSPLVPGGDDKPMTERGYVTADIDRFKDLSSIEAMRKVVAALRDSGKHAEVTENWRLRDWLISRQRYWGTPIPIIHCSSCGAVPVPVQDLPVELPSLPDSFFDGRKGNPLAEDENWKKTKCPKCGSAAERETDTMDTFMDSSWYFFRFLDPKAEAALTDSTKANKGMPVDLYVGGVEHAILHLLYARFISKFLASTPVWPEGSHVKGEPFKQLITQGMVHGETFSDPDNGRFLKPDEVDLSTPSAPRIKATGLTPTVSYEKMSKSKYNGVDPGATIASYGADATRAHMLFQAPVGDVLEWDPKKITGVQRWLLRVVRLSNTSWIPDDLLANFEIPENPDMTLVDILTYLDQKGHLKLPHPSNKSSAETASSVLLAMLSPETSRLWAETQRIIASVSESYSQTYSLNTIISDLMTLTNIIYDAPSNSILSSYLKWYAMAHLVRMIAPIAPGVAEEAWHLLNGSPNIKINAGSHSSRHLTVFAAGLPTADLDIIPRLTRSFKCVVQVDGKRKFEVELEKIPESHALGDPEYESRWTLDQLVQTKEGKEWLHQENGKIWSLSDTKEPHKIFKLVPSDWNVVIANRGRLCNLVGPKRKKTNKSVSGSVAKDADAPAAVSHHQSSKLNATALKQCSDETPTTTRNNKETLNQTEDIKHSLNGRTDLQNTNARYSNEERDKTLQHESEVEQSKSATVRDDGTIRLLPSLSTSELPLQEVHTRVEALMESLPGYLRPHYVPPQLYPVQTQAVLHALRVTDQLPPECSRAEISARYKAEYSSSPTPPTIAPKYIVKATPRDLSAFTQADIIELYNAIFPEQLALLAHAPCTSDSTSAFLPGQNKVILRKLRMYRKWSNDLVARSKSDTGASPVRSAGFTTSDLERELHMSAQEILAEQARLGTFGHLNKSWVLDQKDFVRGVWQEIIQLWAGLEGKKEGKVTSKQRTVARQVEVKERESGPEDWEWAMGKEPGPDLEEDSWLEEIEQKDENEGWTFLDGKPPKSAEDQEKEDAKFQFDWTWLAGDEPEPARRPHGKKRGLPRWG